MAHLTPLDKTVAGKELIQMGIEQGLERGLEKGLERGIEKGKLIGKIQMAQRVLKQSVIAEDTLGNFSFKKLKAMLSELEAQLP